MQNKREKIWKGKKLGYNLAYIFSQQFANSVNYPQHLKNRNVFIVPTTKGNMELLKNVVAVN
jgi:hypothetical protein